MSRLALARILVVLITGVLVAAAPVHAQTTWYVDDDASGDPGPGDPLVSDPLEDGSPAHPFDAIQEGIGAAVNGDTVLVLDGTYTGNGNRDLDFGGRLITVRSENGPDTCIIDCEANGRGFGFGSGETNASTVDGFTITNGIAAEGGAVYCDHSSPTITNCTITENVATGTYSAYGGGVYCWWYSDATISNCTISQNVAADDGGGIFCEHSDPTISNCTISQNAAGGSGGGVYCWWYSDATISNCTISQNEAEGDGAGIYFRYSSPTINNCTISQNETMWFGGGVFCRDSSNPTIINCTMTQNSSGCG